MVRQYLRENILKYKPKIIRDHSPVWKFKIGLETSWGSIRPDSGRVNDSILSIFKNGCYKSNVTGDQILLEKDAGYCKKPAAIYSEDTGLVPEDEGND